MNQVWIAAFLPLFLSPQSEPKSSCCSGDDAAKCEKVCQEMKEKMKACKDLARQEVEKAMEAAKKAAHDGMIGAHAAMQAAHQELEKALQAAKAQSGKTSVWWDGKKLKELDLAGQPYAAFSVGQDGQWKRIDSDKNLKELAEELRSAQGDPSADRDDDPDDEMETDSADEAADEAAIQAEEAEVAAKEAEEVAAQETKVSGDELRLLKGLGYASSEGQSAGGGQSRGLEKRIAALEERLGVHSDGSQSSLEERVAALERLALPHPAPQPWILKTPRPPRPARAFALPRMPADVAPPPTPSAPAPVTPRVYVAQPGQAWGRALTPQANTPPVPPRPAEAPLAIGARREPADLRREIDARMSKMREEMNRLREEMNRLREELRRQEDQAR